MTGTTHSVQDILQVCRNGHVITDRLRTFPERGLSHCDRCGATTLDRCPTCGQELAGGEPISGLQPIGQRKPPESCSQCGAAFPWSHRGSSAPAGTPALLENLLRRLPRVVRELRSRHGERPAFRVNDEHDLEDLLRALLPLHFDDIRPESRTPSYSKATRTDFVLVSPESGQATAVAIKRATPALGDHQLVAELEEDAAYYRRRNGIRALFVLIYDPEGRLHEPAELERAWSRSEGGPEVHCIIGV